MSLPSETSGQQYTYTANPHGNC